MPIPNDTFDLYKHNWIVHWISRQRCRLIEECKIEIEKYIEYYNYKRIKEKGHEPSTVPDSYPSSSLAISTI
ncbi:IS3 family transposase [Paenibacillus sp. LX16]|uniref:IS3 family transposase n=1 Tax=Paenibacillus sp. LX16 TaxID=1740264 RepID=UPI003FA7670F